MKTKLLLLFAAMALCLGTCLAQSSNNEDEVVKIDKWNQQAYREGEILVKFKPGSAVQMRAPQKQAFHTTRDNAIDALFQEIGVDSVEQLMPRTGHKNVGRKVRAYNGSMIEVKDLSKLYRVTLRPENAPQMYDAIERLKVNDEVEFAEPNYLVYTMSLPYDTIIPTQDAFIYSREPLYSQQWGPAAIGLPQLWNKPKKSSKRPVIAILDTGVDVEHPDLAANIWTNPAEANGISGQDDDANGFKDDLHGWDFINQTGVIADFNGHGTHCAGIAAAVGNNGIGITGANPDALIMPVTVMQSNGTGDVVTIIRGIDYAAANGADVISMSIGGYGYSMAEEQALGRAYANAVLVAAAGNDGHAMVAPNHCLYDAPMFPAAFSFVLGVEASIDAIGNLAGFSNYDESGPIYSPFGEDKLYNYELRAPGVQILSTFPGGRYKKLNGTSMACPLVAGAISRLLQCKEILNQELLFGDLIHTRVVGGLGNVNVLSAYNIADSDRHPELSLVSYNLVDSAGGDDDGRADAGETIEIYPIFKNAWGQAENIRFWIKTGQDLQGSWVWDDTTLITHLQDTAYFGKPLSSYAKATSANPWRITINPNCSDGRKINLTLYAKSDNMQGVLTQHITLDVENGVELRGLISEDMILYPNVHYIVSDNLGVPSGVTLTIKPGSIIKIRDDCGISISGHLNAKGTCDSLIVFTSAASRVESSTSARNEITRLYVGNNFDTIRYVKFENLVSSSYVVEGNAIYENCIFLNNLVPNNFFSPSYFSKFSNICIYDCFIDFFGVRNGFVENSNFINNHNNFMLQNNDFVQYTTFDNSNIYNFDIYEYKGLSVFYITGTPQNLSPSKNNYLGTSRIDIAHSRVVDINWTIMSKGFGALDLSNILTRPSAEAHGIVWKILVNGYDAQDEFDSIPPLGVGTHRCDVFFNRPMDVAIAPSISFGVRKPYTQHQVTENGSWSADSTIYTAYFTIDAKTVSDGLNTIKVYGAEDNEHFEIPEESFRFHMEIAAAGSMSTGLMAEAGLGKVTLTWETDEEDFEDLLGYNIYRWTGDTVWYNNNRNWRIDTICINTSLIDAQDTSFIDYDVVPGKAYYYIIRQMTTSLNSYDISNPVTATPLTAIKGDANGSMSVDVADIITEANYITLQNPQPFIFEAADVNSDNKVDVIDIVGTVNIILHPQANTNAITNAPAYYYVQNGILYVETDVVLGGVQLSLNGDSDEAVTPLDALNGFEKIGLWQTDEDYLFLAYSMSGKTLGVGTHALLQIGDADITSLVLSDAQGHNVEAVPQASTALDGTKYMPNSRKYLEDGHLYIQIGNTVYSASGQLVK